MSEPKNTDNGSDILKHQEKIRKINYDLDQLYKKTGRSRGDIQKAQPAIDKLRKRRMELARQRDLQRLAACKHHEGPVLREDLSTILQKAGVGHSARSERKGQPISQGLVVDLERLLAKRSKRGKKQVRNHITDRDESQ